MRKIITASEGHILTDGDTYGTLIYLAEGNDGSDYYEITLDEYNSILTSEDADEEDYRAALCEMGVSL